MKRRMSLHGNPYRKSPLKSWPTRFSRQRYGIVLALASCRAQNFLRRPNVRMADMFRMTAWERPIGMAHSLILWASHLTDLSRVDVARSSRFLC